MSKIGYSRCSTISQNLDYQIDLLEKAGCEKIYQEKASGKDVQRIELVKMLDFVRQDDEIVITSMSRISRNVKDLLDLVELLKNKGVSLVILDQDLDTKTANGKLMLSIIGAINQFQREIMLEKQALGILIAKNKGKYKGRKPSAMSQKDKVKELVQTGMKKTEIAKMLKISEASVYRCLSN